METNQGSPLEQEARRLTKKVIAQDASPTREAAVYNRCLESLGWVQEQAHESTDEKWQEILSAEQDRAHEASIFATANAKLVIESRDKVTNSLRAAREKLNQAIKERDEATGHMNNVLHERDELRAAIGVMVPTCLRVLLDVLPDDAAIDRKAALGTLDRVNAAMDRKSNHWQDIDTLRAENEQLKNRVGHLETTNQRLVAVANRNHEVTQKVEAKRDKIKADHKRLSEFCIDLDKKRDAAYKRAETAETELAALRECVDTARAVASVATINTLRAENERLRDQITNGIVENDDGTYRVAWTKEEVEQIKDEAEGYARAFGNEPSATREELRVERDTLKAEVSRLLDHGARVCLERDKLAAEVEELKCREGEDASKATPHRADGD